MQISGYTITDLSPIDEGSSAAYGVNTSGQAVGKVSIGPSRAEIQRACVWWGNGRTTDLGTLGGSTSCAYGINVSGQPVGSADIAGDIAHAFRWDRGTMQDLGTLPGHRESIAYGINASDQVVGYAYNAMGGDGRAFYYADSGMQDLGTLGGRYSWANAINDVGQVVGWAETPGRETHAFLWTRGQMTDLGTLGGKESRAYSINVHGHIVGSSYLSNGERHACLWKDGQTVDLGALDGGDSLAKGINDDGHVVGIAGWRAFLYVDGVMMDLNNLIPPSSGWKLSQATGINNRSQIVGSGQFKGTAHGFLLSPK